MAFDARERLERFRGGVGTLSEEMPETIGAMLGFVGAAQGEGVLSVREKELISIGIAVITRCEDCIAVHTYQALEAGCTRAEILEAAGVALTLGGGPSLGASASLLVDALNEFQNDFPQGKLVS